MEKCKYRKKSFGIWDDFPIVALSEKGLKRGDNGRGWL